MPATTVSFEKSDPHDRRMLSRLRGKMRASVHHQCERSDFVPGIGSEQFDASIASGGVKALLAAIGFILCCWVARMFNWRWIIGTSGGFTPAAALSGRIPIKPLLRMVLHTDFGSMFTCNVCRLRRVWSMLRLTRYHLTRPRKGIMSSGNFRHFNDTCLTQHCESEWPESLLVPATSEEGNLIVMCAAGVFEQQPGCDFVQIRERPVSLGTAAVATSAIPGVFDAVEVDGKRLYDGVIAGGASPVEPLTIFGGEKRRLMIFDVGEDGIKKVWWMRCLWRLFSLGRGAPIDTRHVEESEDVMVIRCEVTGFHGLQFTLSSSDKWRAIMCGYLATVRRWQAAKMISASTHPQVYELAKVFSSLLANSTQLAADVEDALAKRNLW